MVPPAGKDRVGPRRGHRSAGYVTSDLTQEPPCCELYSCFQDFFFFQLKCIVNVLQVSNTILEMVYSII